jgi:phosphoserine aminotransferase
MARIYDFCAGPAALPEKVLKKASAEMLNWHAKGLSIMEMSLCSPEYVSVAKKAEQDLRDLLPVLGNYKVLFMQGGAMVPMNFLRSKKSADYVNIGQWSEKAIKEANNYCDVRVAASSEDKGFSYVPTILAKT